VHDVNRQYQPVKMWNNEFPPKDYYVRFGSSINNEKLLALPGENGNNVLIYDRDLFTLRNRIPVNEYIIDCNIICDDSYTKLFIINKTGNAKVYIIDAKFEGILISTTPSFHYQHNVTSISFTGKGK